jgi:hypothetical protein
MTHLWKNNWDCKMGNLSSFLVKDSQLSEWCVTNYVTPALVIVPTRELCLQVYGIAQQLVHRFHWLVPGYVMGGESRSKEKARLRKGISCPIKHFLPFLVYYCLCKIVYFESAHFFQGYQFLLLLLGACWTTYNVLPHLFIQICAG